MCPILYDKTIKEIIKTTFINNIEIQSGKIKNSIMKELALKIIRSTNSLVSIINNPTLILTIIKNKKIIKNYHLHVHFYNYLKFIL